MKKSSVAANYIYNVAYQILTFLTPIITAPYLSRTLGADNLGKFNYTYSIVYWFILFGTMGISLYGSKEIAKVSNDREKLSKKFSEIFSLQFLCTLISLIIYYFVFLTFDFKYHMVFLLQGGMLLSSMFEITWFYVGLENFKKTTFRGFIIKLLMVSGILLLVHNENDLYLYMTFIIIMNVIGSLMIWVGINKIIDFKIPKFKDIVPHFKENFVLFIPQISSSIYSVFDQTMIGLLYDDISEVGFYTQAHKLVNMLMFIITTIGTVMLPNIVRKKSEKNDDTVKLITNNTFKIALFLSIPIAIGFSVVSPFFIPWFLPKDFGKVAYIICCLTPTIVFISLSNVFGMQYLIVNDESKKYTISVTSGCVVNIVLNALLIGRFGAYGAAIASSITELVILLIQYNFVKKTFNFDGIIKKIFRYLGVGILMGAGALGVGLVMGSGILTNIVQVLVGMLIYFGILFIMHDDIEHFLIDKFLVTFRLKKK